MDGYRIVSSDDHVMEPADVWTSRAESRFRARVPQIVRTEDGVDWWYCDSYRILSVQPGTQTGVRFEEPEKLRRTDTFENVRPGGYIPEEHLKDMDVDGIDMSILYPTTGLLLFSIPDSELLTVNCRIYNDWVAEFCGAFPKQLKGIAMVNVDDAQSGVRELERSAKLGFAGAMITVYPPEDRSYDSPEYEPLWAAAQDQQMPLSLHSATNRADPAQEFPDFESTRPASICNSEHWVRMSIGDMIFSVVFERYPKLQVGSIELDLSWVPHFLDRIDYNYTQRARRENWLRFKEDMLPSDYFHRNVFVSFQEDALA